MRREPNPLLEATVTRGLRPPVPGPQPDRWAQRTGARILQAYGEGFNMGNVENIEKQVQQLSADELAEFRRWFAEFDAQLWDRQFESDVKSGKLDALADEALQAHKSGQSTKL